jgi:4-amino-4-deoxy-L-arabinose transferase-like glycosyltransferase
LRKKQLVTKFHVDLGVQPKEIIHLFLVLSLAILLYSIFMLVPAFQSDEAIYTYAAYAITRGIVPYRQITLVHPPLMYLAYTIPISLAGPNLVATRTFSFAIFLCAVVLTYFLGRKLQLPHSFSLLASALYALYPASIPFAFTSLLANLLAVFSLGSLIFYVTRKKKMLFLAGFIMGLALMTWYLALFLYLSLFIYHILCSILRKISIRRIIIETVIMLFGSLIPILFCIGWISLVWNATPQFYSQTLMLQITREVHTTMEKLVSITLYIEYFCPLLLLSLVGALISIIYLRKSVFNFLMLAFISISYPLFLILMNKTLFIHYFLPITPYLVVLGVFGLYAINTSLSELREVHVKSEIKHFMMTLLSILIVVGTVMSLQRYSFYAHYLQFGYVNPHTQMEMCIGARIANLTSSNEMIWTSEPSIAFFAQRLIAPPNSTVWPLQGFFNDVFDTPFVDSYGVVHEGKGLVKICQFIQSWETHDVRVVVFIDGSGAVPYPDSLIWEGFTEEQGTEEWVKQNFRLEEIAISTEVGYSYNVWLRGE